MLFDKYKTRRRTTRRSMNFGTAAVFALAISLTMHLLFGIMSLYGRDAVIPDNAPGQAQAAAFHGARLLASFVQTFLITFVIYLINFRILKMKRSEGTKLALIIICTILVTVLLSWLSSVLHMSIFDPPRNPSKMMRGGIMRDLFISVIVVFSSQLVYVSQRRQQMALEYEALKAENALTKFEVLKNQVDPHFLFNSLNTLNSMIQLDPEKAQEYVHKLSSVFRYTLQSPESTTLEEELKFTDAYCSLMQIRYGESLRFEIKIDVKYMQHLIIPLSIQTMVENAVKHNVVSNKYPLTVTIMTEEDGGTVVVSNPIQPKKEAETGAGIGLANIADRYRLKWKTEIVVDESEGFFTVTIPLIKP